MRRILLISILFSLFACTPKQTEELLILPKPIELEAIEYPNEFVASIPQAIKVIDNKLLLINDDARRGNIPVIYVMDASTGKIIQEWGHYGNGPDECLSSVYWGSDDTKHLIRLFDISQYIFKEYYWENTSEKVEFTLLRKIQAPKYNTNYWDGTGLENGNFVVFAIMGPDKPSVLLNNQLDSLTTFGDIPADGVVTNPMKFYITYDRKFTSWKNKFVAVMLYLGNITCYEQEKDGEVHKLWERYIEKPIYNPSKEGQLDMKQLRNGFREVIMNNKYIFATYSGFKNTTEISKIPNARIPKTILMFDHKGNLLYNFHTKDRRIGAIALSEDGKTIYAVTYEPEVAIVRFDISKYV